MEVLSSRIIVRCPDLTASTAFWCDVVGLRVAREYGLDGIRTGVVLFTGGGGQLELTGPEPGGEHRPAGVVLWLQVVDVDVEAARLATAGVAVEDPSTRPWGLREAWFDAPDGVQVALVQVPDDHPLRSRLR